MGLSFAVGLGFFTSVLIGNKRDLRFALGYVLRAWFFVTPVIYPSSLVPERWRAVATMNPMTTVVELFKRGMLGAQPNEDPGHLPATIPLLALSLVAGVWFFARVQKLRARPDADGDDED
jgi:lipopolysaccharide transport system permease protein